MPPQLVVRNGTQFVRLDNGVEVPEEMWADLNNQLPQGQAHGPAVNDGSLTDNLGTTAAVPKIPSIPMPFGTAVDVPMQQPQQPAASMQQSAHSAYSTELPYRRTDVQTAPSVTPDPAREAALGASRNAEMGYAADQVGALRTQQAAVAGKQEFMNGTDANGNLRANSGSQRLLDERNLAESDRAEFEQHVAEAGAQREQRIAHRIAQIPAEDPAKMWQGTEGGLARAAGIISSAIGGLLAVSTGSGRNLGLEALEHTIDRDINSQRANIESEWRKVAADQSEYDRFRQQMGDERSWKSEQAAYRYASLATKLEAESAKFDSASKQAELQGFAAQVMQKAQEKYTEALRYGNESDVNASKLALDRWYKTESLSLEERQVSTAEGTAAAKAAATKQPVPVHTLSNGKKLYIDPQYSADMGKSQVDKLRTDTVEQARIIDQLAAHRQLISDLGSKYAGPGTNTRWGDEDAQAVKNSLKDLASTIAQMKSGSAYSEAFRHDIEKLVGEPRSWFGADPLKSQNMLIDRYLDSMDRDLGGRGVGEIGPDGQFQRLNTKANFGPGDVTNNNPTGDVTGDIRGLGRSVLTSDDPDTVLRAVRQLTNTSDAPLAVGSSAVTMAFAGSKVGKAGGKYTVTPTTEDVYGDTRNIDQSVTLMRTAVNRAAAKAKADGDPQKAADLVKAADELEKRLRGVRPPDPGINLLDMNSPAAPGQGIAN